MKYLGLLIAIALVVGGILFFGRTTTHNVTEQTPISTTQSPSKAVLPTAAESSSSATPTGIVTKEDTMAKTKTYTKSPEMTIDPKKTYTATLVTNKGKMIINLYAGENPITVNNFVFLAREGFYANTPFHRVIKGFMIQGGDPTGTGMGGPGYKFDDEKVTREYTKGTIAMANSGPNTNGSQFFIMHANYPLPKNYVIFGSIDLKDADSLKTLDALGNTPVTTSSSGEQSKPTEALTLRSVTILEK